MSLNGRREPLGKRSLIEIAKMDDDELQMLVMASLLLLADRWQQPLTSIVWQMYEDLREEEQADA